MAGKVVAPGATLGSEVEQEPNWKPLYMLSLTPVVGTLAPGVESVSRWMELSAKAGPMVATANRTRVMAITVFLIS